MKNYVDFNYEALDPEQIKYLNQLSIFSKYKKNIIQLFGMNKASMEGKIAFLESNSMKLGAIIFNRLEEARLNVQHGYYIFPYFAAGVAFGCFLVFARFTPMHSKLYKEVGYSCLIGAATGYSYIYYNRMKYYGVVNDSYAHLRKVFDKNPELEKLKEDEGIIKTFGFNRFSFMDEGEASDTWEEEVKAERSIFDGSPDEDGELSKAEISRAFTG